MADHIHETATKLIHALEGEYVKLSAGEYLTIAAALRQAERDGALRVLEEVERVERTTCASSVTALREVSARITRGEFP
jgi:hypothetical protein